MNAAFLKRRLKGLAATALAGLGVSRLSPLSSRGQTLLVLCYHRVLPARDLPDCPSSPFIVVCEDTFARQMAQLAAACAVLPLEDGLERLARQTLPRRAVAITFDDGWKDTLTTALPILERHDLPALVYLTTNSIGTGRVFWQERLRHSLRLLQARGLSLAPGTLPPDLDALWQRAHQAGRLQVHRLTGLLKRAGPGMPDAGERLAAALSAFLDHPPLPETAAMLSWDDVATLQARGVAFGSHTLDHLLLPDIPPEQRAAQLAGSRQVLRERLGQDVRVLAYPNGDHSLAVRKAALEAGYTSAATLEHGFNSESLDLMRLRRVNLYEHKTAGPKGYAPELFQWILMTGR